MLAFLRNLKTNLCLGIELLVPMGELNILGFITFGFAAEERLSSLLIMENPSTLPPLTLINKLAVAKAAEARQPHSN